jgi:hypothetical protein
VSELAIERSATPAFASAANVLAKGALVLLLVLALLHPEQGNMHDKAAGILGNRMDLYDTVVWFDDWMHLMNTGLLAAAFILLTLPRQVGLGRVLERALAFGATAAIVIHRSWRGGRLLQPAPLT